MKLFFLTNTLALAWVLFFGACLAQTPKDPHYCLKVNKTQEVIKMDGELLEATWKEAEKANRFYQQFPYDSSFANHPTEVMMSFDDTHLYLAAICYDTTPGKYIVSSLRRDFSGRNNDFFTVYLDPFGDGINGFTFGVTPYGVQREALISNGDNLNGDWDNKWFSAAKHYGDYYVVEMAIPFKTLRYKSGATAWKVNFARINKRNNENSSWVPVARNFRLSNLAFTGELKFNAPLPETGVNISLIPFVSTIVQEDREAGEDASYNLEFGGDVKIAVTSSLNLDLTVNPDFSQVEVDRQVTNLSRFELFFPERRQFFLENQDLFSRFGFSRIRPFFSRRIGIGEDSTTGDRVQIPILFGARLSGKVDKNWRVGLLNMQTQREPRFGVEGQNYTVATFQRQVFARSNIAGIFVNRQRTSGGDEIQGEDSTAYNRVVGLDYNLSSQDNKWRGKFFFHQSLSPQQKANAYAHASFLGYFTPNFDLIWNHEFVGENYQADLGFVPRTNHWRLEPFARIKFYPQNPKTKVNVHGFGIGNSTFWDTDGLLTDRFFGLSYFFEFLNTSSLEFEVNNEYNLLFSDFDPTNTGGEELLSGEDFSYTRYGLFYESDSRRLFNYELGINLGQFFNGTLSSVSTRVSYRFPPYVQLSVSVDYNQIDLPEPFNDANLFLIQPRFDFTFRKNVFLTLFSQFNSQDDNINLNARFQWRFKPVSDLFVVYTENYLSDPLQTRNRSLVLKLTYWLNL